MFRPAGPRRPVDARHSIPGPRRVAHRGAIVGSIAGGFFIPTLGALEALSQPWSVDKLHDQRVQARLDVAMLLGDAALCVQAVDAIGASYPWEEKALRQRLSCYERASHPGLANARDELARFRLGAARDFGGDLRPSRLLAPLELGGGR